MFEVLSSPIGDMLTLPIVSDHTLPVAQDMERHSLVMVKFYLDRGLSEYSIEFIITL